MHSFRPTAPRTLRRLAMLAACCLAASCGTAGEKGATPLGDSLAATPAMTSADPLADTKWRLVEIQSMDDARGTKYPDDRNNYLMTLNRDGTVAMQLNCNRANGNWKATPSADRTNGSFEFGPLATTKALCPPPSLDEQVAADAQNVRGYMLKDGRLSLTLMADGGIYLWEPANVEEPFLTTPDTALETAILAASPSYTKAVTDASGGLGRARYIYGRKDLNGDGKDETLVYLLGSVFCGTGGCNLMLFQEANGGYALVNDFPISRPPVIVSPKTTNGWHDLLRLESGGGAEATYVRHMFDGSKYVESERKPVEQYAPEGQWLLAGELSNTVGVTLVPRK